MLSARPIAAGPRAWDQERVPRKTDALDARIKNLLAEFETGLIWNHHGWLVVSSRHSSAMEELAQIGGRTVSPLTTLLEHPEPGTRYLAVKALAKVRDRAAVEPLLAKLDERDMGMRQEVIHALSRFPNPPVVRALDSLLSQGGPPGSRLPSDGADLGETAAQSLAQMGAPGVRVLLDAARDADPTRRFHAGYGLSLSRDRRVVDVLLSLLEDPNDHVRNAAIWQLGWRKEKKAVLPLIDAYRTSIPRMRQTILQALGEIGDARALDALFAAAREDHPLLRMDSVAALGKFRHQRVVEALGAALSDTDEMVRHNAVLGLGSQGRAASIPMLIRATEDPSIDVRKAAAQTLAGLRAREALPALRALMERDGVYTPSYTAARDAIARIEGKKPR
jgi:HEAT repeat protein